MDIVSIEPRMLKGTVTVPPSKSVAHRAIICAALSGGACCISNVALSRDIEATLRCMRALGAAFRTSAGKMQVTFSPGRKKTRLKELILDCGESGSTLRFLMPIALLAGRR